MVQENNLISFVLLSRLFSALRKFNKIGKPSFTQSNALLRSQTQRARLSLSGDTDLVNEVDGGLQVQSKVNELPLDALALVLFLLQDEHGVVEQLLQLLVGVVDAQLLKRVQLKPQPLVTASY